MPGSSRAKRGGGDRHQGAHSHNDIAGWKAGTAEHPQHRIRKVDDAGRVDGGEIATNTLCMDGAKIQCAVRLFIRTNLERHDGRFSGRPAAG